MSSREVSTAAVIGGGYIGMEMVDALSRRGIQTTVIEYADTVLTTVDTDLGNRVKQELERNRVSVITKTAVKEIAQTEDRLIVKTAQGLEVPTEMVIVATGSGPNIDLARSSGVDIGRFGAIKVDHQMRTNLQVMVLSGIGEPLLHQHLERFISIAKSHMPPGSWVGFQSNGLLIDEHRADSLIEAGIDRICLSIDTVDPEGFRLIRKGGELSGVVRALQVLNAARTNARAPLKTGIEFVLMKDNMKDLPETIRWAGSMAIDFAIVTHLFPYHSDLSAETAYDTVSDASAAFFLKHLKRAEKKGLNLRRYNDLYLREMKTPEDRKIVTLVETMKQATRRKKASMNIQSLFTMNPARAEEVQLIFEEARAAASSAKLDPKLPSVFPKRERRCEFVEEGCAFVSVDGFVHPCYQLWHCYRYCMYGTENKVGTKVFGKLSDRGILEIWNDPAFIAFRSNVLKYDHPYCFDCGFALCGNVNIDEFERDCYLNTEPCGACLWCMDMLRCLK